MTPERVCMFENVYSEASPEAYFHSYVVERYPDQEAHLLSELACAIASDYNAMKLSPLRIATESELKAVLPRERHADLRLHQRALKKAMVDKCFLPESETIMREEVSALIEPHPILARGTVVYRRETDKAAMVFALPYSILDFETGTFTHTLLTTRAPANRVMLLAAAGDDPRVTVIDSGLTIASVLVWALPEPYGAIGAGVLTLAQILFGLVAHPDGSSPVIDAIKSAVATLQYYVDLKVIEDKYGDMLAFQEWIVEQEEVLKVLGGDPAAYIEARIMGVLDRMLTPGAGTMPKAIAVLETMFCNIDPKDADAYRQKLSLLNQIVAAVSLYLLALRMRLIFDLVLAEHHANKGNTVEEQRLVDIWFGDYAHFLVIVRGADGGKMQSLPDRIDAHLSDLKKARLELIKLERMPEEGHTIRIPVPPSSPRSGPTFSTMYVRDKEAGWGYTDQVTGGSVRISNDDDHASCCRKIVEHQDIAEQSLAAYRSQLTSREFAKETAAISQWRSAANSWEEHHPPLAPKSAPTVSDDWSEPISNAPKTSHWSTGNEVRYAVTFKNLKGPSGMSPPSDWVLIKDRMFPLLKDLPKDPLDMTSKLYIYRCFRSEETKWRLIGHVSTSAESWRDSIP